MTDALEIRLLGRFSVRRGGHEVPPAEFGGRLVRTLLRVLVSRRGTLVSRDVLTEALWPERPPADPSANLKVLVSRGRRALGEPSPIMTLAGGYAFLAGGDCAVDAEAFLDAVEAGLAELAAGHADPALRRLQRGLALWRGDPLPEDAYADWARGYRDRLLRAYQQGLEGAAQAALAADSAETAVTFAERAVSAEPLREAAHLLRVRALDAARDRAAALAAFAELRERLATELGLDPSPAAIELQRRILRGEQPAAAPARRHGLASVARVEQLPLAGRDGELAAILAAIGDTGQAVVVLQGRSGAGKSRLLAEIAERARVPVIAARAFLPERDEPWALARSLLREVLAFDVDAAGAVPDRAVQALAGLVPEIADLRHVGSEPLDHESRRALLLEAGGRLLGAAAGGGALLLVDDLQWADDSSLRLLARTLGRHEGLDVVFALRPDEAGAAVTAFVAELEAAHGTRPTALPPLDADAIGSLVADPPLAGVIVADTDRTPMAVAEVLRRLAGEDAVWRDAEGRWHARGPDAVGRAREAARVGQQRSIARRSRRQRGSCRLLLNLLALLGRETPARLLASATETGEREVLDDLDELGRADLVRLGDQGWAAAHDLVAETVAAQLSSAELAHLHGLLATALRAANADPVELARHLDGAGDREAAAQAYADAARVSLDRFADAEAARLAEAGLALAAAPRTRAALLEVRAETSARRGDVEAAEGDLKEVLAGQLPGEDRSRALARLAMLSSGARDLVRASGLAELALVEAGGDPAARARALAVAAILDMNLERPDRAHDRSEEALRLFEQLGDGRGVAGILDGRAMATFLDGRIRDGVDAFERVATLFEDSGDLLATVTPRSTRGHGCVFLGVPERGLAETARALDLARTLGHQDSEALALWHHSEALTACGRPRDGAAAAEAALEVASRLGHRGWIATAWRGMGVAEQAAGDLARAERDFTASLESSEHLPLFACWASARLALVLIAQGRIDEAAPFVGRAFRESLPLAQYEARLARAELAAAREDPTAPAIARAALTAARDGGHLVSVPRLSELAW